MGNKVYCREREVLHMLKAVLFPDAASLYPGHVCG